MINLLPPEYQEEIRYARKNSRTISWLSTVIFGIVILFFVAVVGRLTIQTARNQAEVQKSELTAYIGTDELKSIEKDYLDYVNGTENVKKVYSQQILYSRLIRKLGTLLPPGAKLTNISLSDKDQAISLNFSNTAEGLGPTIQINLLNQGEQIAGQTRDILTNAFGIQFGGEISPNEPLIPVINTDQSKKEITYFVNLPTVDNAGQEKYNSLKKALVNGGEFAFQLVEPIIKSNQYDKPDPSNTRPLYVEYKVDTSAKTVDLYFYANKIDDVYSVRDKLSAVQYPAFIETYVFQDKSYIYDNNCKIARDKEAEITCEIKCPSSNDDSCSPSQKICTTIKPLGCKFVLRGYYDELYTSASITEATQSEKELCVKYMSCTHKVTAKFNQLFDKVDINSVSNCAFDTNSGLLNCPVDIRAQFSSNAKFYLVSTGVGL